MVSKYSGKACWISRNSYYLEIAWQRETPIFCKTHTNPIFLSSWFLTWTLRNCELHSSLTEVYLLYHLTAKFPLLQCTFWACIDTHIPKKAYVKFLKTSGLFWYAWVESNVFCNLKNKKIYALIFFYLH